MTTARLHGLSSCITGAVSRKAAISWGRYWAAKADSKDSSWASDMSSERVFDAVACSATCQRVLLEDSQGPPASLDVHRRVQGEWRDGKWLYQAVKWTSWCLLRRRLKAVIILWHNWVEDALQRVTHPVTLPYLNFFYFFEQPRSSTYTSFPHIYHCQDRTIYRWRNALWIKHLTTLWMSAFLRKCGNLITGNRSQSPHVYGGIYK